MNDEDRELLKEKITDAFNCADRFEGQISRHQIHPLRLLDLIEENEELTEKLEEAQNTIGRLGYALERLVKTDAAIGPDQRWIDALLVAKHALKGFDT